MEQLNSDLAHLHGLVQNLAEKENSSCLVDKQTDEIIKRMGEISRQDIEKVDQKSIIAKLEQGAVSLWNLVVAKRTAGILNHQLNARLRQVSCSLAFYCCTNDSHINTYRRQILMAMKTARAWLDSSNHSMAESPLIMASECINKARQMVLDGIDASNLDDESEMNKQKLQFDKDDFFVHCYRAEAAIGQDAFDMAASFIEKAKEMLLLLPQEVGFLSMLCYNFGVEAFQQDQYEHCVTWLQTSFEVGKTTDVVGAKNQARTLRLLAHAYLEWDGKLHWQKALNAVALANSEHAHAAGLYLKVRILLQGDQLDHRVLSGIDDILGHADLTVDLGIDVIKLLLQYERGELAVKGLKQLEQRYQQSPEMLAKVAVVHLKVLLQLKRSTDAKQLLAQFDFGQLLKLDITVKKQFQILLWEQAATAFEDKEFSDALEWYNYSLNLLVDTEHELGGDNLAKLHRNRASCFLSLGQLSQAGEAVKEAELMDSASPYTQYIRLKVALAEDNEDTALDAIERMSIVPSEGNIPEDTTDQLALICLTAQLAFERSNRVVAVKALEHLVEKTSNCQQMLTALRCLIRLKLSFLTDDNKRDELGSLVLYVEKAHVKLQELTEKCVLSENHQNEAVWFMKIAWNMALKCNEDYRKMSKLFTLCAKLSGLCKEDKACLVRQKTCQLMAAAASLKVASITKDDTLKTSALQECISHVEQCHQVCSKINRLMFLESDSQITDNTTAVLLVLYEFEAKARLRDPNLEAVLEKALSLPHAEPKAFETIAALCLSAGVASRSLMVRALKVAIKKHLQLPTVDFMQCSKAFHSLIELALQSPCSTEAASKDEAWGYYLDVLDIIDKANGSYPEMEALWLMTKAWNCGISFYSINKIKSAMQWCELAMKMLKFIGSLKNSYEEQMTSVYSEILSKVEDFQENSHTF